MSEIKSSYSSDELAAMSDEELARLGTELDGVTVAYRKERFPVENDPAEKRAAFGINVWFALSVVLGIAFVAVYLFWPWQYKHLEEDGLWMYTLYTPLLGATAGLSIICLGVGAVQFSKKFVPEEISVQTRHDGPSEEVDRKTITALLNDAWKTSTLGRRKVMMGLAGTGAALMGLAVVLPLGGIIKNPWKPKAIAEEHNGHYTTQGVNRLVRVRPEDLDAGAMETVFPLSEEMVNDGEKYDSNKDVYEEHMHSVHGPRNAVMLIRLRHEDAVKAVQRDGQEDFHYGDYYAYSKICTHIGCPTSLYEQQTNRILCPCHQSQFDALHWGKPVFGPAARALPELSINVDADGYLYAEHNFIEPVGPAFWERKS